MIESPITKHTTQENSGAGIVSMVSAGAQKLTYPQSVASRSNIHRSLLVAFTSLGILMLTIRGTFIDLNGTMRSYFITRNRAKYVTRIHIRMFVGRRTHANAARTKQCRSLGISARFLTKHSSYLSGRSGCISSGSCSDRTLSAMLASLACRSDHSHGQ